MITYDETGRKYKLIDSPDKGGEGRICLVEGNSGICAKIFKPEKVSRGKYAKVTEWMRLRKAGALDANFFDQVTVPLACLYLRADRQDLSSFIGYTMKRHKNFYTLRDVYINDSLDYRGKVTAALNLCIITNNLHKKEVIIGDFNADNILMFKNSKAALIDADSMQLVIDSGGRRVLLPCNVGKPEFMPPEITTRLKREKADLKSAAQSVNDPIFTLYSDYYMLSFHIFSLLMNGAAPYSSMADMAELSRHPSKTVSDVDLSRAGAALKGEFIYAKKQGLKKPPDYAPDYEILNDSLKSLFEKSFIYGAADPCLRPGPCEYYAPLKDYLCSLQERPCGHYMPSHYKGDCVWCELGGKNR